MTLVVARENDLDLVLIAESSDPPVAKILILASGVRRVKAKAAVKKAASTAGEGNQISPGNGR